MNHAITDQNVIDCLDSALASRGLGARVDTAAMPPGMFQRLAIEFERRARIIVERTHHEIGLRSVSRPHVFLCEDEGFGAFALRSRHDYIVIRLGTVATFETFFPRMLATEGLWPNVGDALSIVDVETPPTAVLPAYLSWKILPIVVPSDPTRVAFAVTLMGHCLELIVRHEIAHLVLGHLDFDISEDVLASQALELAADGHAAIWSFELLRTSERISTMNGGGVIDGYREFHRSKQSEMENFLLAMYFLFRVLDEDGHKLGSTHPPAPMRFHVACIHLDEHFERIGNASARALLHQADTWKVGEEIFAKTLGRTPDSSVREVALNEQSKRHYERLSARARLLPQNLFGIDVTAM